MDPLLAAQTILTACKAIYDLAAELKVLAAGVSANHRQCSRLSERVTAIAAHLPAIEKRTREKETKRKNEGVKLSQADAAAETATATQLQRLSATVESAVALVRKFTAAHYVRKLIERADYTRDFAELNEELQQASVDLQLGFAVAAMFDHAKDASDAQFDLQAILAGQQQIMQAAGRIEAEQKDASAKQSELLSDQRHSCWSIVDHPAHSQHSVPPAAACVDAPHTRRVPAEAPSWRAHAECTAGEAHRTIGVLSLRPSPTTVPFGHATSR